MSGETLSDHEVDVRWTAILEDLARPALAADEAWRRLGGDMAQAMERSREAEGAIDGRTGP